MSIEVLYLPKKFIPPPKKKQTNFWLRPCYLHKPTEYMILDLYFQRITTVEEYIVVL